jgi:hypothetical protein
MSNAPSATSATTTSTPACKAATENATTSAKRSSRTATTTSATTTPATVTPAKPKFEWPEDPQALFVRYLEAEVTADEDAPNRRKSFVSENGSTVLRVHSSDWREWLAGERRGRGAQVRGGQGPARRRPRAEGLRHPRRSGQVGRVPHR